jgi:hypothetical protein
MLCECLACLEQLQCQVGVQRQVCLGAQGLGVDSRPQHLAQDETRVAAGSLTCEGTALLAISQMSMNKL